MLVTDVEDAQDAAAAVRSVINDLMRGLEFNFEVRPEGSALNVEPTIISNADAFREE